MHEKCIMLFSPLYIGNLQIEWSDCIKYLGVYVVNYLQTY